jgi:hypothetical protein
MPPPPSTDDSSQKTAPTLTDESIASSRAKQDRGDDASQELHLSVLSGEIKHPACHNGSCRPADKEHHSQCRKNPDAIGRYYRVPRFLKDPPAEDSNKLAAEVQKFVDSGSADTTEAVALRNRINAVLDLPGGRGTDFALFEVSDKLQEVIDKNLKR